jgi:leucyl-tRNA---protein transferase
MPVVDEAAAVAVERPQWGCFARVAGPRIIRRADQSHSGSRSDRRETSLTRELRDAPQFYLTAPSPCPYLPGREERKVFTHLIGRRATALNDTLTQSGFRRSQTIAYRPACETCRSCVSVRVKVAEFSPSKSLRRVLDHNRDLQSTIVRTEPTSEQYSLFRAYLDLRHADGGMADMTVLDYSMMVEDSHVESRLIEYRRRSEDPHAPAELMAVCLTDLLADGLSMVYSFYAPEEEKRSLGTFMILDHIERAQRLGLPHVYLGYWVDGSKKMAYKARFLPQERLGMVGWERID